MQLEIFPNPLVRARRIYPYVVVLMPSITNVPAAELRRPVGDLTAYRGRIVDAIDWMFLGI
jgi:hypothetical protein